MNRPSTTRCDCRDPRRPAQRGFTLVELMVAILIGLFLLGGLVTLTSALKRTGSIQGNLSQLHDSERIALSLMTDVIQSSGYFPSPIGATTASTAFPVVGSTWASAQTIQGTDVGTGSTQTDTIAVRYSSAGGDGVLNCIGGTSTVAASWIAAFSLDGLGDLQCLLTTNGVAAAAPVTIASGVQYMQILYGVQTNAAAGTFSVDTYLTATQVTAGNYWPSVISVQVTLWFTNPLYCTTQCLAGQQTTQPQTIPVSRTIAVMSKAGVNT
ncbi:MAG: PilW family protein [Steroidobacteraceae bacterium]|jgi:type IV pilus assembly protein PilW